MRTLLCFLILVSTVFAEGVVEKKLDVVEVKISIEAKGVVIDGKFYGKLNEEEHKAASKQLWALKEKGRLKVFISVADDTSQKLVIDVLNLLVGLDISKVTFTDVAE